MAASGTKSVGRKELIKDTKECKGIKTERG
jgi:hypothetical protein